VIGCCALNVQYGRAPENVYPGPVNDTVMCYKCPLYQGLLRLRPEKISPVVQRSQHLQLNSSCRRAELNTVITTQQYGILSCISRKLDLIHTASSLLQNILCRGDQRPGVKVNVRVCGRAVEGYSGGAEPQSGAPIATSCVDAHRRRSNQ
jgi:hypothetical protein